MNELTFQYKYLIINRYGGIENIRILRVNKEINRVITRVETYSYPIESLRKILMGRVKRYTRRIHSLMLLPFPLPHSISIAV